MGQLRGWRKNFDQLISDEEARERVHRIFQPARNRIWDAPDLSDAVREMLKDIPGKRLKWLSITGFLRWLVSLPRNLTRRGLTL